MWWIWYSNTPKTCLFGSETFKLIMSLGLHVYGYLHILETLVTHFQLEWFQVLTWNPLDWNLVIEFQWLFWWQGWLVKVMSNDCYVCRFECEWSIICLCMFPKMVEFWASITLEPNVPETQVSKSMALHRSKASRLNDNIPK